MTTLRDDGYLETDSPVMAACFIGKSGIMLSTPLSWVIRTLEGVFNRGVSTGGVWFDYPIRVPADVVAEVVEIDSNEPNYERFVITLAVYTMGDEAQSVFFSDWLRKHTTKGVGE